MKYFKKNLTIIFGLLITFLCFAYQSKVFAGSPNLSITGIVLTNEVPGKTGHIYQRISPIIDLTIVNKGDDLNFPGNIAQGFITCKNSIGIQVFNSAPFVGIVILKNTSMSLSSLTLSNILTQVAGPQSFNCTVNAFNSPIFGPVSTSPNFNIIVDAIAVGRFDQTMDLVKKPIETKLDTAIATTGAQSVNDLIYKLIDKIIIPLAIALGILLAIIGFYKLLFSDNDGDIAKGTDYLIWGVAGIIVMVSAKYIGSVLYEQIFQKGNIQVFSAVDIVNKMYDKIIYPFLKITIYVVVGILFIQLLIRIFSFIGSEEGQKTSIGIITWNIVGILVILGAKQIIEAVYGKQKDVLNQNAINVGDIGRGFLNNKTIPILYESIRRIMGIAGFIVLAIILWQAFKLLLAPTEEKNISSIKSNILYVLIGILVIGACYLIVNFVIFSHN